MNIDKFEQPQNAKKYTKAMLNIELGHFSMEKNLLIAEWMNKCGRIVC